MAQGQRTNRILVRGAEQALEQMKYEAAAEVGITPPPDGYWGDIPARLNGAVGGHMVKRLIQQAESQMAGGFQPGAARPAPQPQPPQPQPQR